MATDISKLVAFPAPSYPTLPNTNTPVFMTNTFRAIAQAIASIETAAKAGALGVSVVTATPTTTNLAAGSAGVFKVTGGAVYLAYNDAGTIKKVALT